MELDAGRGYDLIGDIHGCAHTLERLLDRLGYRKQGDVWRHPWRMALFLGDLIDRGPRIREALHLVHAMVEAGQARCIMGNHEYNALGWVTPAPAGSGRTFVHDHTPRHTRLLMETLEQFEAHPGDWHDFLRWFQDLPLFIDGGRFRLVHACWDHDLIEAVRRDYPDGRIDAAFIQASAERGGFAERVFKRLLRGTDLPLPGGMTLTGSDGFTRSVFRTKFWEDNLRGRGLPARCAAGRRGAAATLRRPPLGAAELRRQRAAAVRRALLAPRTPGAAAPQPGLPGLQRRDVRQAGGLPAGR